MNRKYDWTWQRSLVMICFFSFSPFLLHFFFVCIRYPYLSTFVHSFAFRCVREKWERARSLNVLSSQRESSPWKKGKFVFTFYELNNKSNHLLTHTNGVQNAQDNKQFADVGIFFLLTNPQLAWALETVARNVRCLWRRWPVSHSFLHSPHSWRTGGR